MWWRSFLVSCLLSQMSIITRRYVRLVAPITFTVGTFLIWQLYGGFRLNENAVLQSNHHDQNIFLNESDFDELLKSSYRFILTNKIFDGSGSFFVVKNVNSIWKQLPSIYTNSNSSSITLVTQCSFNHLHNLIRIRQFWDGPISVSVFIPKYQLIVSLNIILRLMQCYPSVMNNIHVHVVLPHHNITSKLFVVGDQLKNMCSHLRQHLEEIDNIFENYQWKEFVYPNNLLRNVAESTCETPFKLILDIDIFPSPSLHNKFTQMLRKHPLYINQMQKFAYVIPVFETVTWKVLAKIETKKNLLTSIDMNKTRPFYQALCAKCQHATNYKKWMKLEISLDLKGAYEITWEPSYEPFYIVPTTAPAYDERFSQYGFNRVSHACELHVGGYRFIVLNNAFLLHNTFKSKTSFHVKKSDDEYMNRIKYEQFKDDLLLKYPTSSRFC